MGKKPVLGLASLVLASVALSGCRESCCGGMAGSKTVAPHGSQVVQQPQNSYPPGTTFGKNTPKPVSNPWQQQPAVNPYQQQPATNLWQQQPVSTVSAPVPASTAGTGVVDPLVVGSMSAPAGGTQPAPQYGTRPVEDYYYPQRGGNVSSGFGSTPPSAPPSYPSTGTTISAPLPPVSPPQYVPLDPPPVSGGTGLSRSPTPLPGSPPPYQGMTIPPSVQQPILDNP